MQLAVLKLDSKNELGFFFRTIPIGFERHFNKDILTLYSL